MLINIGIRAGIQAARNAGVWEPCPRAAITSFKKKITNAMIIAINNLFPIPCLPIGITEKIAPRRTIPISKIGVDSILCK